MIIDEPCLFVLCLYVICRFEFDYESMVLKKVQFMRLFQKNKYLGANTETQLNAGLYELGFHIN